MDREGLADPPTGDDAAVLRAARCYRSLRRVAHRQSFMPNPSCSPSRWSFIQDSDCGLSKLPSRSGPSISSSVYIVSADSQSPGFLKMRILAVPLRLVTKE